MEPGPGFQLPLLARTISSRRFAPEREDSDSNLSAARRRRPLGTLIIATLFAGNPLNMSASCLGSGLVDLSVIASIASFSVVLLTAGYVFYIRRSEEHTSELQS